MQRLGMVRPIFIHAGRIRQVRLRVLFLRVHEVRKLHGIIQKEHWCVVANQIKVTFIRVELNSEAPRVTRIVAGILPAPPRWKIARILPSVAQPPAENSPACIR